MKVIAYLDPGTGSLIMQAVLGGTAGIAVLFKSKGKRFFRKGQPEEVPSEAHDADTETPAVPNAPTD